MNAIHYCWSWPNRTPLSTFSMPTRAIAPSSRRWACHRCTEKAISLGSKTTISSYRPSPSLSMQYGRTKEESNPQVFLGSDDSGATEMTLVKKHLPVGFFCRFPPATRDAAKAIVGEPNEKIDCP